jgi:serine protease Do
LIGFFAGIAGTAVLLSLVYFTAWAADTAPAITVDSKPLVRDVHAGSSYAAVIKKAAPSVVNISTTQTIHERRFRRPSYNDPFYRQGGERTRRVESLGSGVVVSPDGYILTANHVVEGADEIKVSLADGKKEFPARVIGSDRPTDVAILKIDATGLPAVTLGDSGQLEVGDVVLAIGNPFGIGQSVTAGIISGLGRRMDEPQQGYVIQDFIQTDAAINQGNSGGALVDTEGRLIGINTMILTAESIHGISDLGGNEGIGFAVPVNLARHVMERLIAGGKVSRGYLGVVSQDVDAGLAESFHLPEQGGALVGGVVANTPAANGGVKIGDVIVGLNGKPVPDVQGLNFLVSECPPGSTATLKFIRDGEERTIAVKIEARPDDLPQAPARSIVKATGTDGLDGVLVDDLNALARRQLAIPDSIQGAIVTDVAQDSNASQAGLAENDVIVEINQKPVAKADEAVNLCNQATTKRVLLKIWRSDGQASSTRFVSVDNTKRK